MNKPSKENYIKAIAEMLEKIPTDRVERLYGYIQFIWRKYSIGNLSKKQKSIKGNS